MPMRISGVLNLSEGLMAPALVRTLIAVFLIQQTLTEQPSERGDLLFAKMSGK